MTDFRKKLEKVINFFHPDHLSSLLLKYEGKAALLVIDVQKEFCDPKGRRGNRTTAKVSRRIQSLTPEFRKAGIPVYAVYFSYKKRQKAADIDFYEFTPHPDDTLIRKDRDSAFKGSKIKEILKKDKKNLLLTCGFNLNACVRDTVIDANKEGFDVCLLSDLTGNDNTNDAHTKMEMLRELRKKGISVAKSGNVLKKLPSIRKNA